MNKIKDFFPEFITNFKKDSGITPLVMAAQNFGEGNFLGVNFIRRKNVQYGFMKKIDIAKSVEIIKLMAPMYNGFGGKKQPRSRKGAIEYFKVRSKMTDKGLAIINEIDTRSVAKKLSVEVRHVNLAKAIIRYEMLRPAA